MLPLIFIALGVTGIVGALVLAFSGDAAASAVRHYAKFDLRAKQSYLPFNSRRVFIISGVANAFAVVLAWFVFRPSFLFDLILLAAGAFGSYGAANLFLSMKAAKRQVAFMPQLEMVLRMLSSSLSVGLGLRQAIVLVTQDVAEPARTEFMRIIGRTNIGISILDALDEMALRMPSSEMSMTARAIRVQAQTGGDLAKVLDNVASTIQSRRMLVRKMSALTAEGRISGIVILSLPFVVCAFIAIAQPKMGHALFFTMVGQISLGLAVALELAAGLSLKKIMRFDP